MKRRAFTLLEMLVVVALVALLGLILFPLFARSRCYDCNRPSCQVKLKQIGLATLQYQQDYDETLPPVAATGPAFGWADAIQPYLKSTQIYQCPQETSSSGSANPNPRAAGYTDYWMNRRLSSFLLAKVTTPAKTILCGDGNAGIGSTDARYSKANLPAAWLADQNSPAYRHLGLMNLLFADGHVKATKPQSIAASPSRGPSFALR